VVLWVDGADPEWRASRDRALAEHASQTRHMEEYAGACRFREWGTFPFFFRALEANAPWFRRHHLVTPGHLPSRLNPRHPKLHIVRHADIFESPEDLPTFNTNAIHANIDNIEGLAEQFVLFDDDCFIMQPTPPMRFFERNLPKDHIRIERRPLADTIFAKFVHRSILRLHGHFDLNRLNVLRLPLVSRGYDLRLNAHNIKYYLISLTAPRGELYTPLSLYHFPQPLLKHCVREVKAAFAEDFAATSAHRFRHPEDMSAYAFRYWQLLTRQFLRFAGSRENRLLLLSSAEDWVEDAARHLCDDVRFLCVNDAVPLAPAEEKRLRCLLLERMEAIFPRKSSFEL